MDTLRKQHHSTVYGMQLGTIVGVIASIVFALVFTFTMALGLSTVAKAEGIFSQIVLPFDSKRVYAYKYSKTDHALVIEFKNTPPAELEGLEHYDERLIRRLMVKDMGPAGTEVKLILRDRDVKAYVTHFEEPFRITIDIFDAGYEEGRDATTGLPQSESPVAVTQTTDSAPTPNGNFSLLVSDDGSGLASPSQQYNRTPVTYNNATGNSEAGRRRLLQPTPELFAQPGQMAETMKNTAAGIGKHWRTYPPYIYRMQTTFFEGDSQKRWTKEDRLRAVKDAKAMADYAGKLYNFGHENRALVAYQQVLHKDSSIFDRDALHLFKFAEINLGQGNMTLARGYYNELVTKHPASALATFSKLRLLDIKAIRMLHQDEYSELPKLVDPLNSIATSNNGDLNALIAIRQAHWSKEGLGKSYDDAYLPPLNEKTYSALASAYNTVESKNTKFHSANLILNHALNDKKRWSRATGDFAANYFKTYDGKASDPWRTNLKRKLYDTLNTVLQSKVANGQLVSAIEDYESLPRALRGIKQTPRTAWALAEAYRKLGQTGNSVNLYDLAARKSVSAPDKFKAYFWLAVSANEKANDLAASNGSTNQIQRLRKSSREADKMMQANWNTLKEAEQDEFATAYKEHFEKTITESNSLKTPARIALRNWTKGLATNVSASNGGELTDWDRHFSPTGSAVFLLKDLAKRFSQLGMTSERRESLKLLKQMKPSQFADDKQAKKLWANELVALAEDYRKSSQNLDAGRIYALVGKESEDWEGRAEALYKGGLLLFKAGRREEALQALTNASNDGNNLFYANLARERLSQIK